MSRKFIFGALAIIVSVGVLLALLVAARYPAMRQSLEQSWPFAPPRLQHLAEDQMPDFVKSPHDVEWRHAGFDSQLRRSVPVPVLTAQSASQMAPLWHLNDPHPHKNQVQSSAGFIDGVLITGTANGDFVGLSLTGAELWRHRPQYGRFARRGWTTYKADGVVRLFASEGPRLACLTVHDGKPCSDFGTNGYVDTCGDSPVSPVIHDKIITIFGSGFCASSFHVSDGTVRWHKQLNNDMPDNFGATAWAGVAVSEKFGLAVLGTANAKPDFDGRDRPGHNHLANSLVAIDLSDGAIKWAFQEVHHDIWDLDIAAPPIIATTTIKGRGLRDVAIATSKQGNVIIVDLESGALLSETTERPVPRSPITNEQTAPTQPVFSWPQPIAKMALSVDDLAFWNAREPETVTAISDRLSAGTTGFMQPHVPGKSSYYFGVHGGAEWPGGAFDERSGTYFIAANHIPWAVEFAASTAAQYGLNDEIDGAAIFNGRCGACHKGNLGKLKNFIEQDLTGDALIAQITQGKGAMPAITMPEGELTALIAFLRNPDAFNILSSPDILTFERFSQLTTTAGYPATNPPWATLNKRSLNLQSPDWVTPFGDTDLGKTLGTPTGVEAFAGITHIANDGQAGLLAATGAKDKMIYLIDAADGTILWRYELPFTGAAAPTVFAWDGKVYMFVQATGGGKLRKFDKRIRAGNSFVLFALTQE